MQKLFHFFLTKCEKRFSFFDKVQNVFQFFRQNAKNVLLFSIKCEKYFNFFDKMRSVSIFSTKCEKCFTFFDKMRKIFQFFWQNAKSVLLFFDKMRKVFQFFLQKVKSVYKMQYRLAIFLVVYSFSSVFPKFCAKTNQIF